ncbi:MAG: hypothetical protein AAGC60_01445 [Acidobacteriota bacterium]
MSSPTARLVQRLTTSVLFIPCLLVAVQARGAEQPAGWRSVQVPATGSFARWYFPGGDSAVERPAVVFLHGSGGTPFDYQPFLGDPATAADVVVIVPKSLDGVQWGVRDGAVDAPSGGDPATIAEALDQVLGEVAIDPRRVGLAGHSDGGAYAADLAFGSSSPLRARWSAVFQLSAPFRPPDDPVLDAYRPPVRMYYGTTDPNHATAYPRYLAYWPHHGVPFEDDVRAGFGHSNWPEDSMIQGLTFLASHHRPTEDDDGGDDGDDDTVLRLRGGRFEVLATWRDFDDRTGIGRAVAGAPPSDEAGMLWFFGPTNWELLVKVLDGCALNARLWVFAAATTDVEYTLRVLDTATGLERTYVNALGDASPAVTDTDAFATCDAR